MKDELTSTILFLFNRGVLHELSGYSVIAICYDRQVKTARLAPETDVMATENIVLGDAGGWQHNLEWGQVRVERGTCFDRGSISYWMLTINIKFTLN